MLVLNADDVIGVSDVGFFSMGLFLFFDVGVYYVDVGLVVDWKVLFFK